MKTILSVAVLLLAARLMAEKQPFERYQSIIDRQMFGKTPAGFDPTRPSSEAPRNADAKALTEEEQQVKSAIHFSVINVTPSGETAVGFTDNSDASAPIHYYLKVGESRNGWTVVEADPVKATMKIEKDGIAVEMTIGENTGGKQPNGAAKRGAGGAAGGPLMRGGSLRDRRAQREADRRAASEEEKRKAEEEKARRDEEEARRQAEKEAEKAEREKDRAEMQAQLQALREGLAAQREEEARKQEMEGSGEEGEAQSE